MSGINDLIASVLQVDPASLKEEDSRYTLEVWDSLRTLMLASTIEITYNVTLSNDDIERLTSVADVKDVVARYVPS